MKSNKYLLAGTVASVMFICANVQANGPWPTAVEDSVTLTSNQRVYLPILSNDIGQELVLFDVNTTTVALGRVEMDATKKAVYYQSAENYTGDDSFWYAFTDNIGRTNAAKVSVKVMEPVIIIPEEPEEPELPDYSGWPAANTDIVSTPQDTSIRVPVLANDIGQDLALFDVNASTVAGGFAVIQGDEIVYTPRDGFSGEDSFWYAFSDNRGRTNSTQVKVTVTENDVAAPDAQTSFTLVTMHDDVLKRRSQIYGETGGTELYEVIQPAGEGETQIRLEQTTGLKQSQLMTYKAEDGEYYTVKIAEVNGQTVTLESPLEGEIDRGEHVWNFYYDGAHPNLYGFRAIADFALRQQGAETLNSGKHVMLGDSWFSTEGIMQRLEGKLDRAQFVNLGVGGKTTANLLADFDQKVVPQAPDFVWLIAGTNDYFQGVSVENYTRNMSQLISKVKALGAEAVVIDSSVAPLMSGDDYLTNISHEYAAEVAGLLEE